MIAVKNLSKKFKDITAVDSIDFEVKKGEIFAFLGPNGAGKSTTIKMCTTLLKPSSGKLVINGHDVAEEPSLVRKSFGIVFQDTSLDDELTAEENMNYHGVLYGYPKADRKKRVEEMLEFVELWDRRKTLVKKFSGGMKRRLEIARGLMHHPALLFLDEPTLGLDPQTRNHIWQYIVGLNKKEGLTVFFTTHYLEEAESYADRIAIMDKGVIIAIGTASELKEKTGTNKLEEAFIKLTGSQIRPEEAGSVDQMRAHRKQWRR